MKKHAIFSAVLTGLLAISLQLSSNEIAQTGASPSPSMKATQTPPSPVMSTDPSNNLSATRVIEAFRESLKANHGAGAIAVYSAAGNMTTSFAEMGKEQLAAAQLDKRMVTANNKAFTSSYMGTDTAKISDAELSRHKASLANNTQLTNLAGGVIIQDAASKPIGTIGVSAVGSNGQDLSAKIAAEMAQQLSSNSPENKNGALEKK